MKIPVCPKCGHEGDPESRGCRFRHACPSSRMLYDPKLRIRLICGTCKRLGLYPAVPKIVNDLPRCCGRAMLICGSPKLWHGAVIDPADNLSQNSMEVAA